MSLPEPYYEDDSVKLYHGDCREIVPGLGRFDLLMTDPPYGLGHDGQKASVVNGRSIRKHYESAGWDGGAPTKDTMQEMMGVADHSVVFGGNYVPVPHGHKGWIVWDKAQRGLTMSDAELVFTTLDRPTRIISLHRSRLWREGPQHPTQKPLELTETILSSVDCDTVLDPFAGSGTTLVAAKNLGRQAIGIEIEERYCEIAAERLSQETLDLGGAA